jgi:hypothetical protein
VTNNREILRMVCAVILATAVGCSTGSPPAPVVEPGSKAGILPVTTKDLPKGAKLGTGKAVID